MEDSNHTICNTLTYPLDLGGFNFYLVCEIIDSIVIFLYTPLFYFVSFQIWIQL